MAGEIAGAVTERDLLSAVFSGQAGLADPVSKFMGEAFPLIGAGEPVSAATNELSKVDALMVVHPKDLGDAWHGDRVVAAVTRERKDKNHEGRIARVIERGVVTLPSGWSSAWPRTCICAAPPTPATP